MSSAFEDRRSTLEEKAVVRLEGILDDPGVPDGILLNAIGKVLDRTTPAAKSVNVNLHQVAEFRYTPAASLADDVLRAALPEGEL